MLLFVINGPNLNLLGRRLPDVYGTETLDSIMMELKLYIESCGSEMVGVQTNHEGEIIDMIQDSREDIDGIILNAGAYTHYSYAIRDAIEACDVPVVEVHMSDIYNREEFRRHSVLSDVCLSTISGKGKQSYFEAATLLLKQNLN